MIGIAAVVGIDGGVDGTKLGVCYFVLLGRLGSALRKTMIGIAPVVGIDGGVDGAKLRVCYLVLLGRLRLRLGKRNCGYFSHCESCEDGVDKSELHLVWRTLNGLY